MNNFDNLFEEEELNFDPQKKRAIKAGIWHSLSTYRFVGQIVDVYLPAMVDVLVSCVGGNAGDPPGADGPPGDITSPPDIGPDLKPPLSPFK